MPGCAPWKSASASGRRGASAAVAATRTTPRVTPVWRSMSAFARATSASTASAWTSRSAPAAVSSTPFDVRRSSFSPSSASSRRICCESAGCVT